MNIYKNLCIYLASLCILAIVAIVVLSLPYFDSVHIAYLVAPVSIFSVSLVCLIASFVMYRSTQDSFIVTLKRRAGRVYGELNHHKMRLIDIMDGKRTFVDIEKYLYPEDAFLKIKKFLYEEYFTLYSYDPFFKNSLSHVAIKQFRALHKDLSTFMRSQNYDIVEYNKLKILYSKIYRQPIVDDTPEENFNHPELQEAMDNFRSGLDYALINADQLMSFLDIQLTTLDSFFAVGVTWPVNKARFDREFQDWVRTNN